MGLISRDEAMQIIQPHAKALRAIPIDAWADYHLKLPEAMVVAFCARTRANAIHDLMVRNAIKYCTTSPDVRIFERQQMLGMTIAGKLAIRLKKLDEDGLSRNQPTQQVQDFRAQETLDGIEATHNLELGYVLNEHETEILEVRLVHPSGDGIYWWAKLGDDGDTGFGTVELFTPPNTPPQDRPPKIGPKKIGDVVPLRKKDGNKGNEN